MIVRNVARASAERLRHGFDFRFQQNDVRRLAGEIAGAAHGNAEVGLLQRRRIVDAVAHERHALALGLEFFHELRLLLRPHPGKNIFHRNAGLLGDGCSRYAKLSPVSRDTF